MPEATASLADETCIKHPIGAGCSSGEDEVARVGGLDRFIAEIAARQHGVVARGQLLDAGVSRRAIAVRLQHGRLHPLHLGVYAVGHTVISRDGVWMAAVLASGSGATLSHRSAAQLWGLARRAVHVPEVTRPRGFRARVGIRAHRSPVPMDECTVVEGIPVTSVPRTILDLAAVGSRRQVERALHEAEVRRLHDPLSVVDLLRRYPRRPGSALLRQVLKRQGAGATINDFEEDFSALLERHGLPLPRFNPDLVVRCRAIKPDCLWEEERLIVELDGREVHGTAQSFENDRERDRLLLLDGWRVIRVTWRQLHDQDAAIAADVRRALSQGSTL